MPASHIDVILSKTGQTSRVELITVAAHIARRYNVKPARALEMLETGEVHYQQQLPDLVESMQKVNCSETEE